MKLRRAASAVVALVRRPAAAQLSGAGLLAYAAGTVARPAGFAVGGLALVLFGVAAERGAG